MGNDNSKPKEKAKEEKEEATMETVVESSKEAIEKEETDTNNLNNLTLKKEDVKEETPTPMEKEIEKDMENEIVEEKVEKVEKVEDKPKINPKIKKSSLLADVCMFFGSLGLIALYASYQDPRHVDTSTPKVRSKSGKIFIPAPEDTIDYSINPSCQIVLSLSSIRDQGYGLFAIEEMKHLPSFSIPLDPVGIEAEILMSIFGGPQLNWASALQSHYYLQNVALGSTSTSTSTISTIKNEITPGDELFVSRDASKEQLQFQMANEIVKDAMGMVKRSPSQYGKQKENKAIQESALKIIKSTAGKFDPNIASLLPTTMENLNKAYLAGTEYQAVQNKTHLQLRSFGKCMNKITQGESTQPNAGVGAFAKRDISKGDLIIPAILSIVENQDLIQDGTTQFHSAAKYCFAHPQSSVQLCHVTSAALINHLSNCEEDAAVRTCANGPNAEYKWSDWNLKNTYAHKMAPPNLYEKYGRHMVTLDIIATRDIPAGDEIFYDYGKDWEKAFELSSSMDNDGVTWNFPMAFRDEIFPAAWRK